jgi:hypothetical protein
MQDDDQLLARQCEQMRLVLGVDREVPEAALLAAVEDPAYADNLLTCRRDPELLDYLLANPPTRRGGVSAVDLIARGARAIALWAKAGFTVVDDATLRRRLDACASCPELRRPPTNSLLYRAAGADFDVNSVCGKCGCVVKTKARLPTEACPAPHPELAGRNRWNEPLASGSPASIIATLEENRHALRSDDM